MASPISRPRPATRNGRAAGKSRWPYFRSFGTPPGHKTHIRRTVLQSIGWHHHSANNDVAFRRKVYWPFCISWIRLPVQLHKRSAELRCNSVLAQAVAWKRDADDRDLLCVCFLFQFLFFREWRGVRFFFIFCRYNGDDPNCASLKTIGNCTDWPRYVLFFIFIF